MADELEVPESVILALPWLAPDNPSSQISRLAYVETGEFMDVGHVIPARSLIVQFYTAAHKPPSIYLYKDVPPEAFSEVKTGGDFASSGKAFNASVKGSYEYARVVVVGHDADG